MAKAFLKAKEIADIATSEIARLGVERDDKIEEMIQSYVGKPILKGALWWKYIHIRTRSEAEDIYYGRGADTWFPPCYGVNARYSKRIAKMEDILNAALGAIAKGDGKVMLDHDEIARITAAST